MQPTRASLFTCSALALACAGSAAFADVTSQEVWDKMRSYYEAQGLTISADEAMEDDRLTLSNFRATMDNDLPDGVGMTMAITTDQITFTDLGDGTVSTNWANPIRFDMLLVEDGDGDMEDEEAPADPMPAPSGAKGGKGGKPAGGGMDAPEDDGMAGGEMDAPEGDTVRMTYTITQEDPSTIISGEIDDLMVAYRAAKMDLTLDILEVTDEEVPPIDMSFTLSDLSSDTSIKDGDLWQIEQVMSLGAMAYTMAVVDPEEELVMNLEGRSAGMEGTASFAMPKEYDPMDLAAAMRDGLAGGLTMTTGAGTTDFTIQADGDLVSGSASLSGSSGDMHLGADGIRYDIAYTGFAMNVKGNEIPFPLSASMDEMAIGLTFPVSASEEPQDFGLRLGLVNLQVDDLIWMILDPTGGLPHDPATLKVDLAGKANWLVDIFDPANIEALEDAEEAPGELHALELRGLELKLAGASLTGQGGFTFDNSDLETFDGLPAPDGAVELKLEGGNGLLDKLIAMGLVPEEEAMGLRMMMAVFTQKADGEDTLTSRIEVKPDGAVSANGQRLQ